MSDLVTVRLTAAEALTLNRYGLLTQYLASQGIDTTRMHCAKDGEELVYSSETVKAETTNGRIEE